MAMATSNTQKTIVSLNSKLALDELQKLKKQVEDLKKKKGDALKKTTTAGQSKMPKKNQTSYSYCQDARKQSRPKHQHALQHGHGQCRRGEGGHEAAEKVRLLPGRRRRSQHTIA